jgi:hypothetical protein
MRPLYPLLLLALLLMAACRPDADDPLSRDTPPPPGPTLATILPGCQASDLETWLEVVVSNGRAFRDQSLTASAMSVETVSMGISQLGSLQSAINQVEVPECVAPAHGLLQDITGAILESLMAYYNGTLDQAQVIEQVSAQTARYDVELGPQLEEAIQALERSYQPGN